MTEMKNNKKEQWSWAEIVCGHTIYPSSKKIQVILLVCNWICEANGNRIKEIEKEKRWIDQYLNLLTKYREYESDYDTQMIEACFSGLTGEDKINLNILKHIENMDNMKLWKYYKGVYKMHVCRRCKREYTFRFYWTMEDNIKMSFCCECQYYAERIHKHEIYQARWISQENLPFLLKMV
jgi:hypothetical protein